MGDIATTDDGDLGRLVRRRELTRREVVEAQLALIEELNPTVNAIVQLRDERALAEADAADAIAGRGEAELGPLDGVPIAIKEHYDVAAMEQTEGSLALRGRISPVDCVAVQRLRAAGALIVAKTNQPDFAMRWNTVSGLYGTTRNPRDTALSAGGSSGGDAAAVASGMVTLGLGSDLGGSVRVPAAFCGVCGLRATPGRIPAEARVPPLDGTPIRDHMNAPGPLARSVADLRVALGVLGGQAVEDPATASAAAGLRDAPPAPGRIARITTQTGARLQPEIEQALDAVTAILVDAGYDVVDAAFPGCERAPDLWGRLVGTEVLMSALPRIRDMMEPSCLQHIETMLALWEPGNDVAAYIDAWVERRQVVRDAALWMEDHPVVLAPIAGMPPPALDFDHFLSSEQTAELVAHMRNVVWVNALGLPSVALPMGVQLVARRFHEEDALQVAEAVMAAVPPVEIARPPAPGRDGGG